MAYEVVELECPGCGSAISVDTKQCPVCFRDIVITTFNSVASMTPLELKKSAHCYEKALSACPDNEKLNMSIAFCYLKLNFYEKALPYFDKAAEYNFDNSEIYFYAAICLLKGRKAFRLVHAEIDRVGEYLNAAVMIEPKGIYYYFWAYIKYDYYFRKHLRTSPDYRECLQLAKKAGLSQTDVKQFYDILGVPKPESL